MTTGDSCLDFGGADAKIVQRTAIFHNFVVTNSFSVLVP